MQAEVRGPALAHLFCLICPLSLLYWLALTPWEVGTFFLSLIPGILPHSLPCGFFVLCQVFTSQRGMLWTLQLSHIRDHPPIYRPSPPSQITHLLISLINCLLSHSQIVEILILNWLHSICCSTSLRAFREVILALEMSLFQLHYSFSNYQPSFVLTAVL